MSVEAGPYHQRQASKRPQIGGPAMMLACSISTYSVASAARSARVF